MSPLLTVRQTAAQLGISVAGVYRAMDRGELGYVKVGHVRRIEPATLERYISARRIGAPADVSIDSYL